MKTFQTITSLEANRLDETLLQAAVATHGGKPASWHILDAMGTSLLGRRMDGASADSFDISRYKAESALRGRKNTAEYQYTNTCELDSDLWVDLGGSAHRDDDNRRAGSNPHFVSWPGAVLIVSGMEGTDNYEIIGAVGVSGRAAPEDHWLAYSTITLVGAEMGEIFSPRNGN